MYQVLYRKWRPKVFSDVVGQSHVTETLKNEIMTGRHAHAYLFTGSRGTGKTTCAKIFAKAVNCLNPQNGDPCGECENCKGIESGSFLDVIEIDAASNNGVENIRDIRSETNFQPVNCKFRVYIIDEVHMLSAGAFNALLKTLEEPPEYVKFVLATTEVHKLPATILSRCQRFDFKRISSTDILERLKYIAGEENASIDDDAGLLIARIADGGMRDAISLLDQCLSVETHVTDDVVSKVAGLTGKAHLFALTDAISAGNSKEGLRIIAELHEASCDMERLCADMINHLRSLMICKTVRDASKILIYNSEEYAMLEKQAENMSLESIIHAMELFQDTVINMKRGTNKRTETELAVIKLSSPLLSADYGSLVKRIAELEKKMNSLASGGIVPPVQRREEETKTRTEKPKPETEKAEKTDSHQETHFEEEKAQPAPKETPGQTKAGQNSDVPLSAWPDVVEKLKETNKLFWATLSDSATYIRGEYLLVDCANNSFKDLIRQPMFANDLRAAVFAVTGERYKLGIYNKPTAAKPKNSPLDDLISRFSQAGVEVEIK